MAKKKDVIVLEENKVLAVKRTGKTLSVNLGVELSVDNAHELQKNLSVWKDWDIEKIVFDATDLVYLTSAGVRVIMFAHLQMKGKPELEFVNCAKEIHKTLGLVGMTSMIHFVEDERNDRGEPANELQQKLSEMRQKDLEDFAAHNDVVLYQMKIDPTED